MLISCAGRINGSLAADGSAQLTVSMSLEPRMSALIQRLSAAGGQTNSNLVLNGPSISQSMSNASFGNVRASLRNTAPAAVDGTIQVSNINHFLTTGNMGGFIFFEQRTGGGRCEIRINMNNGPVILLNFSPEVAGYLGALMAPLATGEVMSKSEYLSLVTSVYGRGVSDEIAGSVIRASIDFPGPITNVRGGSFSGRRAEFNIPLLDLLVLETPINYEVTWN
ncbi:MAG: hypothetical protein FWC03_06425 [Treponema sp.]|nr:hypothetical protein [Treponema sp.]